jgi:hypothetical protein
MAREVDKPTAYNALAKITEPVQNSMLPEPGAIPPVNNLLAALLRR